MVRGLNEIADKLERENPGFQTYYKENTGNLTVVEADLEGETHFFEIANESTTDSLTIEINSEGSVYTVAPTKGFGPLGRRQKITNVAVLAVGDFKILLRE